MTIFIITCLTVLFATLSLAPLFMMDTAGTDSLVSLPE
jgi:hypothetical protein